MHHKSIIHDSRIQVILLMVRWTEETVGVENADRSSYENTLVHSGFGALNISTPKTLAQTFIICSVLHNCEENMHRQTQERYIVWEASL